MRKTKIHLGGDGGYAPVVFTPKGRGYPPPLPAETLKIAGKSPNHGAFRTPRGTPFGATDALRAPYGMIRSVPPVIGIASISNSAAAESDGTR